MRRRWRRRSSTRSRPRQAESEPETEEAESFDLRRRWLQMRRKQPRGSPRWTAIILVLVVFDLALVGARTAVVRALPQTASLFAAIGLPVNLRHLQFEQVSISKEAQDGVATLIVQGAIVSEAGKPVAVPRLRFAARNAAGQEVYAWTTPPPLSILEPGARTEFRSQVATPPVEAHDVMVRFLARMTPERNSPMARILVAEDDDTIRDLVVRALTEDGHELTAAANGAAALDALNQQNGGFDLLLTDVKMPIMDGIALALAAGRDHPDVAIMLMTGFADQRERAHGLDALVHDVIAKPFTVDQIKGAVRERWCSGTWCRATQAGTESIRNPSTAARC